MPLYNYQCDCGLFFEASAPMKDNLKPKPCPQCGNKAERSLPEDLSGSFQQEAQGTGPQNTGVHDFDLNYDRVIGSAATQGWEVNEKRQHVKRQVLTNNPHATKEDLTRNPDGSYSVLSAEERAIHDRSIAINNAAAKLHR